MSSATPYTLIRRRSRSMSITVRHTGEVIVSAPKIIPARLIEAFVNKKSAWIKAKQDYFLKHPVSAYTLLLRTSNRAEYHERRGEALKVLTERLKHFNKHYNLKYTCITIRNQRSRWGSCSEKGNISFNYKLILLPDELRDYVVVHELCHLAELNHSRNFWKLVEETVPDYRKLRKRLKGLD